LYTEAIELEQRTSNESKNSFILFTNRSAARLALDKNEEALKDANLALSGNKSFVKAYYRKASALKKLGSEYEAYQTWVAASDNCEERL